MNKKDNVLISDNFIFDAVDFESVKSSARGVLRTIRGPLAEWDNKNRNNRRYSEKLWDRVLDSSYVKEQMRNKSLFGEANHPPDRFEVDFSRVSHSISDLKKIPEKKQIYGTIDILDTPLGRILNVLYEYGAVLGVSSRAGGTLTERAGFTEVDEDNYQFVTFDVVPFPSVEKARMVSEGTELDKKERILISEEARKEIKGIIEGASESEKSVLREFIGEISNTYCLDEEVLMLEGDESCGSNGEKVRDTTLCLLKDSYRLNRSLVEEKESLQKELDKLKESIEEKGENFEGNTDPEMETSLELLESENAMLKSRLRTFQLVKEKIKLLEGVNKELEKKVLEKSRKLNESVKTEKPNKSDKELGEVISELATVREEKKKLNEMVEERARDLTEAGDRLLEAETKIYEMTILNEEMESKVEGLEEEIKKVRKEGKGKITAAAARVKDVKESFERKIEEQKEEHDKLIEAYNEKISEYEGTLNEYLESSEGLGQEIEKYKDIAASYQMTYESYRKELVKVVSGMYGVSEHEVMVRLDESRPVKAGDLYTICESLSSKARPMNVSVVEAVVDSEEKAENEEKKLKMGDIISGSRRGR